MNWDNLKLFLHVSRYPRLEHGAALTGLDPTTISRRIKALEAELGVTLFERTRRGHILTTTGERIALRAEEMESQVFGVLSEGESAQHTSGRIRLGVTEGLGTTIIAPCLAEFRMEHPHVDVDLIALTGFASVPKRQADMSILLARPTSGNLKIRKLTDYALHLYASESYLAGRAPINSKADLGDHTLVGYVDDLIYSSQLRYLDEVLPGFTPHLCSPSILAQLRMIQSGAGIGILPKFMASEHPNLVCLLKTEIHIRRAFWLSIHADISSFARVRVFVDFIANRMASVT